MGRGARLTGLHSVLIWAVLSLLMVGAVASTPVTLHEQPPAEGSSTHTGQQPTGDSDASFSPDCTNCVVANLSVGAGPGGVTYDSANGDVYVANPQSNNVSIIDGTSLKVVGSIPVSSAPGPLTFDPANGYIYAGQDGCGGSLCGPEGPLTVIDGSNNSLLGYVDVGAEADAIAVDGTNGYVYVAGYFENNMTVVNGANDQVVDWITVGDQPTSDVLDPANGYVYVADYTDNNLTVINMATDGVIGALATGVGPCSLVYDAKNGDIYVGNYDTDNLTIIDGASDKTVGSIAVGPGPSAMALDGATGDLYVADSDSDNVSIVNVTSGTVVANVDLGATPSGVAVDAATGDVYVTAASVDSVFVISTGTVSPPSPCAPPPGQTVLGAGATAVAPLMDTWLFDYTADTIDYNSVGSGVGVVDLSALTTDFASTGAPLDANQNRSMPAQTLTIPESAGPVSVIYNLAGITDLKVNSTFVAEAYEGTITNWNDTLLQALNPGVTLPQATIIVVHRSDSSGSTYAFTQWLSKGVPSWNTSVGYGLSVSWPLVTGEQAEKGSSGVTGYVASTADTLSYVELNFAADNGISSALVENPVGDYIAPSVSSAQAAVTATLAQPHFQLPAGTGNWSGVTMIDAPGASSYPLTSLSYLLVFQAPDVAYGSGITQATAQALWFFLNYTIGTGQSYAASLYYVPLPAEIVSADEVSLASMTWGGAPLGSCVAATHDSVTFSIAPSTCGPLAVNGSAELNGDSQTYLPGTYNITANPCSDFTFQQWNVTGGVSVARADSSGTTVSVTANGTLTAWYVWSGKAATSWSVGFVISPAACGPINFGGFNVANGGSGSFVTGNYSADAPACAGFAFPPVWSVTGSLILPRLGSDPTNVNVVGNGTLTVTYSLVPPPTFYDVRFQVGPSVCAPVDFNGTPQSTDSSVLVLAGSYTMHALPCSTYSFSGATFAWAGESRSQTFASAWGNVSVSTNGTLWVNYTAIHYTVDFLIDPASCGPLTFNYTSSQANLSSTTVRPGSYNVEAPTCAGYSFLGWWETQNLSLEEANAMDDTVQVTGNGTLTARYESSVPTLTSVTLSPVVAELGDGYTQTFQAVASCSATCPAGVTYTWSMTVNAGTLNTTTGPVVTFTAGSGVSGTSLTVTATLNGVQESASAAITVGACAVECGGNPPPSSSAPGFLGLSGDLGWVLLSLVLVVLVVVVVVAVALSGRKKKDPPTAPPSYPPPAVGTYGGGYGFPGNSPQGPPPANPPPPGPAWGPPPR